MSLTGRFDPDFNKATDLPNADLPRNTPEYLAQLEEVLEDDEDDDE
jgi:hypothetical protein